MTEPKIALENFRLFMMTDNFLKAVTFCFKTILRKEPSLSFTEISFRELLAITSKIRFILRDLEQHLLDLPDSMNPKRRYKLASNKNLITGAEELETQKLAATMEKLHRIKFNSKSLGSKKGVVEDLHVKKFKRMHKLDIPMELHTILKKDREDLGKIDAESEGYEQLLEYLEMNRNPIFGVDNPIIVINNICKLLKRQEKTRKEF